MRLHKYGHACGAKPRPHPRLDPWIHTDPEMLSGDRRGSRDPRDPRGQSGRPLLVECHRDDGNADGVASPLGEPLRHMISVGRNVKNTHTHEKQHRTVATNGAICTMRAPVVKSQPILLLIFNFLLFLFLNFLTVNTNWCKLFTTFQERNFFNSY